MVWELRAHDKGAIYYSQEQHSLTYIAEFMSAKGMVVQVLPSDKTNSSKVDPYNEELLNILVGELLEDSRHSTRSQETMGLWVELLSSYYEAK